MSSLNVTRRCSCSSAQKSERPQISEGIVEENARKLTARRILWHRFHFFDIRILEWLQDLGPLAALCMG
jgi:hypothetical protein